MCQHVHSIWLEQDFGLIAPKAHMATGNCHPPSLMLQLSKSKDLPWKNGRITVVVVNKKKLFMSGGKLLWSNSNRFHLFGDIILRLSQTVICMACMLGMAIFVQV